MSLESAVKETADITKTAVKEGVNLIKKAWSIMDAATEKTAPGNDLSPKAISSIQGKATG